jgi:hypothetical protein
MSEMFVSVPEFGRRFALGRSTAYELTSNGTVRTVRVGARVLVPVVEMERYAAELLAAAGITPDATQPRGAAPGAVSLLTSSDDIVKGSAA